MKNKVFFASLSLVALFAACQNEEFINEEMKGSLLDRPTVNLSLDVNTADTRLVSNGNGVGFSTTDQLGAVIVDPTLWTVADNQAIGNNKWVYDATSGRFKTVGTTAIGSWVFYAQYNKAITNSRNGITYSFKQIQEGDATPEESTKDGVDFFISPVVKLDGYEGEDMNLEIKTRSIHTRALINLKFDASLGVSEVQKIVVKNGAANNNRFIVNGKILNTQLAVADIRPSSIPVNETPNSIIQKANNLLGNKGAYNATTLSTTFKDITGTLTSGSAVGTERYLALDCIDHETNQAMKVENGEFKSQMLIPADNYTNLTLYIYTDKGIFKKEIKKAEPENETKPEAEFFLRRGHYVNLANITLSSSENASAFEAAKLSINKDDHFISNDDAATETDGTVVLKTVDLVKAINAISTNGEVEMNVISDENHKTVINKEVMDAIKAKKAELASLQIVFNTRMSIVGETIDNPLVLQDLTFNDGAVLEAGIAEVGVDVNIPSAQDITVNSNTELTFATAATPIYTYNKVINKGTVNVSDVKVEISTIENAGILNIESELIGGEFTNKENAIVNNQGEWTVNTTLTNEVKASINNFGTMTAVATTNNNGMIYNGKTDATEKGTINVKGMFANYATITNYAKSNIIVNAVNPVVAQLNNNGTITNYGNLYCFDGENTINNTGVINSKTGATTYITTNSSAKEKSGTNDLTMGEIIMDGRDDDVSVTTSEQKGYITWKPDVTVATIKYQTGDKFNKIYLKTATTIDDAAVRYVVVENGCGSLTLKNDIQELAFNTGCTIYANKIKIGELVVAEDETVKVPTDNVIGIYEVGDTNSKTTADIDNRGTILVGGNFWTSLQYVPEDLGGGIFASGDGQTSAFHWNETNWN